MAFPIMQAIWVVLQIVIGYNLIMPLIIYMLYSLSRKQRPQTQPAEELDYAIIVTAYEQTQSLPAVVGSLLQLDYRNYIIYIVADKCDISTLNFNDPRVVVLRPPETLGSNTRSHFYAINHFKRKHTLLTIIDSDNLVEPNYLHELNKYFAAGYSAVQGVRKAKNLDTTVACLDAARDMYYHFYDGEALFQIGSSATLAGSGMAFTTQLYQECLGHQDITGAGFDKVLQYEIVRRGYRIAFSPDAVVYDEKTSGSDQLVKQRARWINTWFRYFKFGFHILGNGIAKMSKNSLIFGFILLRPPLFMFLLLSIVFMMANLLIAPMHSLLWAAGFLCFVLSFIIGLRHANPDPRVYKSLIGIPKFIFLQVLSLTKARKANKISVATQHVHTKTIDEIKK
jgi:cellulose synthase/poly-beta-1,6-N-acetylglucosamine synthase-like glycosyltransferase